MNKKSFGVLLFATLVLAAVFFLTQSSSEHANQNITGPLFSELKTDQINKMRLEQGVNNIEIELHEGSWSLPARSYYKADYSKVRSLMLKVLTLTVSQKVTSSEGNFDTLGVSDKAVEGGKSAVKFFEATGKEVAGIYLGELRKKKADQQFGAPSGQYVRRTDQNQTYLIGDPITIVTTVSNWLDTSLANVLPSKIEAVDQYKVSGDNETKEFSLVKKIEQIANPTSEGSTLPKESFEFQGVTPATDERIKEIALTQIPSGLENLTLNDVSKADDPALQGLNFDARTVYSLSNGLKYAVTSAEKEDKSYIKVKVEFDPALADVVKKRAEASAAAASSVAAESNGATSSAAATAAPAPAAVALSNVDEAQKLQAQFKDWVFEIKKFQGGKFRYTKETVVEKKTSASSEASASSVAAPLTPVPPKAPAKKTAK